MILSSPWKKTQMPRPPSETYELRISGGVLGFCIHSNLLRWFQNTSKFEETKGAQEEGSEEEKWKRKRADTWILLFKDLLESENKGSHEMWGLLWI